jgi:hypothetical protein
MPQPTAKIEVKLSFEKSILFFIYTVAQPEPRMKRKSAASSIK